MRLIVGWTGVALFYLGAILAVVVGVRFFGRVARREVRVAQAQGLVVMAGAVSVFGGGLAVTSTYGAKLYRTRSS